MKPYYVSFSGGCTIIYARTAASAERYASRELGAFSGPYTAKEATDADISYVKAMGGWIHREPLAPTPKG